MRAFHAHRGRPGRDDPVGPPRGRGCGRSGGGPTGYRRGYQHPLELPDRSDRASTTGPVWYQVYFAGGRAGAEIAIDRAKRAGCRALLITVDLAASARRTGLPGRGNPYPGRRAQRSSVRPATNRQAAMALRFPA